jgi:hypothetical protein
MPLLCFGMNSRPDLSFQWANGFVAREQNARKAYCERDEWPPAYFWEGDHAAPPGVQQRIRLVPGPDNGAAGQSWKLFCRKHAASVGRKINSDYISTVNSRVDLPNVHNGETSTYTSTRSIHLENMDS